MGHEPQQINTATADTYSGRKIKVGIVGVGSIAAIHMEAYKNIPQVEVTALCDIDEPQLQNAKAAYSINRGYLSIEDMLENEQLDAVDICTWNCSHADCAIYALSRGINVFCEKPMACSAADAEKMKEAADKSGKLLMIGFVLRFFEQTQLALEYAEKMGHIYYSKASYLRRHGAPGGWFCDKTRSGGGPIIDLGVHIIDQTRLIMGNPEPVSVFAVTADRLKDRRKLKDKVMWSPRKSKFDNGIFDVEDFGVLMIRYDNGAVTLIETSYSLNGVDESGKTFYGEHGGLRLDDGKIIYYTTMDDRLCEIEPVARYDGASAISDMFQNELAYFAECVIAGVNKSDTVQAGICVMKIIDAAYKSAQTGHEVVIDAN